MELKTLRGSLPCAFAVLSMSQRAEPWGQTLRSFLLVGMLVGTDPLKRLPTIALYNVARARGMKGLQTIEGRVDERCTRKMV